MSKKNKHVFSCPDVIYLQNKAKKHNRNVLIGLLVGYATVFGAGWLLTKWSEERPVQGPDDNTYDLSSYAEQR